MGQQGKKPIKDPNAPKKPLSAYFLFSQDERLKVKAEFPDYSITEVAKELGRRWLRLIPLLSKVTNNDTKNQGGSMSKPFRHTNLKRRKKTPMPPSNLFQLTSYFRKRRD